MEHENRDSRLTALKDRFSGYEVHDADGEKIGEVNLVFVNENGRSEYVGVDPGLPGAGSALIPLEAVRVDERRRAIEVLPLPLGRVEDGPSYGDDREVTPDFERRVRGYYGLEGSEAPGTRGDNRVASEEPSFESGDRSTTASSTTIGGREMDKDFRASPGGAGERDGGGLRDKTGEVEVQRSEEEVRVGTRQREVGAMKVRKSVRTEREQVRVPKRREEVAIERVPGDGLEASGAEIGEEEVVVQVFEEEVVISKRVVLKEEIRIRKVVVEEEEVVEVDLRKEEVDIEDTTGRSVSRRDG